MNPPRDVIVGAVDRLAILVDPADEAAVAELSRRLGHDVFRVLIVGAAKRGKSTLLNALLGQSILPTGTVPVTAIRTVIRAGVAQGAEVSYLDGHRRTVPVEQLADFVTEVGNPGNRRAVGEVVLQLPSALLASGVELVDTPGVGSIHLHNTQTARETLADMDGAVLVLTADPPITDLERELLREVRRGAVKAFVVLNKTDRHSADELAEASTFTEHVCRAELGDHFQLWKVAARPGLQARLAHDEAGWRASGLAEFEAALRDYFAGSARIDLIRSVAIRGAYLAGGVCDQLAALLSSSELQQADATKRLHRLANTIDNVRVARGESRSSAQGQVQAILTWLNKSAGDFSAQASAGIAAVATAALADAADLPLREAEQAAMNATQTAIRQVVEDWRTATERQLDSDLIALSKRACGQLEAQVADIRDEVRARFGVRLGDWRMSEPLRASDRFYYDFSPPAGQWESLERSIRVRLPGQVGRRQVNRHVQYRADALLDQQVGRVRADLQERLTRTERALLASLDQAFRDGAERVTDALHRGLADQTAGDSKKREEHTQTLARRAEAGLLLDIFQRFSKPAARHQL